MGLHNCWGWKGASAARLLEDPSDYALLSHRDCDGKKKFDRTRPALLDAASSWDPKVPRTKNDRKETIKRYQKDIRIAHDHVMVELNIRNVMAVRWSKTTNFKRRRGGGLLNDESIIKSLHT